MSSNPFYLLSILSSSFLAFFTVAFAIEIIVKVFRIKQHRVRALLRLIPFLSIAIDFLFNRYSIAYWINPLSCASCVQKFILEIFFPELKAHLTQNQISLINHLGADYRHGFFSATCLIFAIVSFIFAIYKLVQASFAAYGLHSIMKNGSLCEKPIYSIKLAKMLKEKHVRIYVSDEIQCPLAAYRNIIIIPRQTIKILSQPEFEVVIAHELEHVKYQDPLVRLLYQLIAVLFWWVPTRTWISKIEQDQEIACDQIVVKYGLNVESIASALIKVSKQAKNDLSHCYFASQTKPTIARMQTILGLSPLNEVNMFGINFLGVTLGGLFLLVCMLWI